MSLASYQLLHSAMFFRLRVQRYEYFSDYASKWVIFLMISVEIFVYFE